MRSCSELAVDYIVMSDETQDCVHNHGIGTVWTTPTQRLKGQSHHTICGDGK